MFVFGAIITSARSYEDSYSKPPGPADFSLATLNGGGSSGPYPDSIGGGGGGGGGGYDYTPNQNYEHHDLHDHHDHHDHHPEPPKGHWEKKMKWKEDWVKEVKTIKKQSHETKWKSVSVPVWQDIEGKVDKI